MGHTDAAFDGVLVAELYGSGEVSGTNPSEDLTDSGGSAGVPPPLGMDGVLENCAEESTAVLIRLGRGVVVDALQIEGLVAACY